MFCIQHCILTSLGQINTNQSHFSSLSLRASIFNCWFLRSPGSIRDRLKRQEGEKRKKKRNPSGTGKRTKCTDSLFSFFLGTNTACNSTGCQIIYRPSNMLPWALWNSKYQPRDWLIAAAGPEDTNTPQWNMQLGCSLLSPLQTDENSAAVKWRSELMKSHQCWKMVSLRLPLTDSGTLGASLCESQAQTKSLVISDGWCSLDHTLNLVTTCHSLDKPLRPYLGFIAAPFAHSMCYHLSPATSSHSSRCHLLKRNLFSCSNPVTIGSWYVFISWATTGPCTLPGAYVHNDLLSIHHFKKKVGHILNPII